MNESIARETGSGIEAELYGARFSDQETRKARQLWKPIVRYLQRYVDVEGATLDIGAGSCHFINLIQSTRRIAMDINVKTLEAYADPGIECVVASAVALGQLASSSLNSVFASNVYEHFLNREDVSCSLHEVFRVLRSGGRFIIMQPNFRYCMKRYYDFFDHRLAFTHEAMDEAVRAVGFHIERVVPQFLPYTTKSSLPQSEALVDLYLKVPVAWKILGGQMLLVAVKP